MAATEPHGRRRAENRMKPVHPGEILRDELAELDLSGCALARALDVPSSRITSILDGQRSVTADAALRLGRYFGTTAHVWPNLQRRMSFAKPRSRRVSASPSEYCLARLT